MLRLVCLLQLASTVAITINNRAALIAELDSWCTVASSSDISEWDVSAVQDMSYVFSPHTDFGTRDTRPHIRTCNPDISGWDTSSVTDMSHMFWDSPHSNVNISSWDVSSVTNMLMVFAGAASFNGNIDSWDVSSLTLGM